MSRYHFLENEPETFVGHGNMGLSGKSAICFCCVFFVCVSEDTLTNMPQVHPYLRG